MKEINKKLGSAVWSGSLPVTTGYVWGPDTFVPRSGLAEVDRLDLTSSRPGVRAGREYSLPWGREEKDSSLLMRWEKGKGVHMGGRKRRDANPCTDGRGGGGGNGEDKVTRGLRRMGVGILGWTVPPACLMLWKGREVRDLAYYLWYGWAFIWCCGDVDGCLCQPRGNERGNPHPLLLARVEVGGVCPGDKDSWGIALQWHD